MRKAGTKGRREGEEEGRRWEGWMEEGRKFLKYLESPKFKETLNEVIGPRNLRNIL